MHIRIDPLDKLFSDYNRQLSGGYCKKCHKFFGVKRLQVAHFHGRRKRSTRWDMDNVAVVCFSCHRELDENPIAKIEFFLEILGQKRFAKLNEIANMTIKEYPIDKVKLKLDFKEKIKLLEV